MLQKCGSVWSATNVTLRQQKALCAFYTDVVILSLAHSSVYIRNPTAVSLLAYGNPPGDETARVTTQYHHNTHSRKPPLDNNRCKLRAVQKNLDLWNAFFLYFLAHWFLCKYILRYNK
jgi:hypothetical protein